MHSKLILDTVHILVFTDISSLILALNIFSSALTQGPVGRPIKEVGGAKSIKIWGDADGLHLT